MPKLDVLPTSEAARILGLDVRTVHRMIKRGTLPAHKLPGRTGSYVINRTDVEAILAAAEPARSAS